MNIELFLKCRPTGRIRRSNLRLKINGLTGQGDPTRMKPVSHGSIPRWRVGLGQDVLKYRGLGWVGSGRVGSGRVGSCQEIFKSHGSGRVGSITFLTSRVGPGRAKRLQKPRGSARVKSTHLNFSWVGSGQLTRPDPTPEV